MSISLNLTLHLPGDKPPFHFGTLTFSLWDARDAHTVVRQLVGKHIRASGWAQDLQAEYWRCRAAALSLVEGVVTDYPQFRQNVLQDREREAVKDEERLARKAERVAR